MATIYSTTQYAGVTSYKTNKRTSAKDDGTRYQADWRDVTGRRIVKGGFLKITEAKKHRDSNVGAKAEGRSVERSPLTYGEWFATWLVVHRGTVGVERGDQLDDTHRLHVLPVIGHKRLVDLKPTDIKSVVATMAGKNLGARYQQLVKRDVSQVLKAAALEEPGVTNVAAGVKTPKLQRRDVGAHALTVAQVEALIARCAEWLRPVVRMLAYAGLRPSELMGLTRKDFDPTTGKLTISEVLREHRGKLTRKKTTKTCTVRTIKLDDDLAADLASRARTMLPDAPFFPAKQGGLLGLTSIRRAFNIGAARTAEFPTWATPYSLRHTCATILAREGVPIHVAARYMGHDPAEFVKTYADVFASDIDDAAEAINRARKAVGE